MAFNFFKRRKILQNLNYLEATPLRKNKHETDEKGLVVIIVPKFKSERMNRMILNKRARNFKIHLDSLGSEVWLHIDGHTKVRDICNQLTEKLGDSIQPAEQRITKFLTMLYEARYISFLEIEEEKQQLS